MLCVGTTAKRRFRCAAIVTVSIAAGASSEAAAATYYWSDSDPVIYSPERPVPMRRQKVRHNAEKPARTVEKEIAAKPQGPVIVAVSISKQQVKVYDVNGFFAEAPVSTGMKGHSTPTGVFSVIQKQKFHRSNIYSGAPMPFMQRITWSGIALHAGVLPGYPASHGCIRMPPNFAVKMYGWTRMGARVLVTPGELSPSSFAHPLLAAFKPAATQPAASAAPDAAQPVGTKADKKASTDAPVTVGSDMELRSSIGHDGNIKPVDTGRAPLREQTHTADASNATGVGTVIASDVSDSDLPTKPGAAVAHQSDAKPAEVKADGAAKPDDAAGAKPANDATAAKASDAAKPDQPTPNTKAATDAPAAPTDAAKDPSRLTDADKPALVKPELKHNSQIALFISRKDSKLYVRQNFAPVFSTPVTIAPSDRPLGTHVFTAAADKTDATEMHWSVVSMPVSVHYAKAEEGTATARHGKKGEAQIEPKAAPLPDSAQEALDRITIPPDVMSWIGEALSSGSSLIVSDQGINQGETGEGTDFIVSLR